jgi:outer membrane protein TolC
MAARDRTRRGWAGFAAAVLAAVAAHAAAAGEPPVFSEADAVAWALQHNPQLMTLRQQHGIAAAAVVIANTYPFNPIVQSFVEWDNGPAISGVTNRVFNEHYARLDLEVHGQGKHRRAAATAALSRTDWEIAAQETALAVRAARAFAALLYRRDQVRHAEETLRFQEETLRQVTRLAEQGRAGRAELLLARADVAEARAARGPAQAAFDLAANELRRVLGLVDEPLYFQGRLSATAPEPDLDGLTRRTLDDRADLRALRLAVDEAEARLRLEVANRWGNPSTGPFFEYNETSDYFIGATLVWPVPICNTRKGEILQRQAERERARLAVRAAEVLAQEDVRAALNRLADATALVDSYRTQTLPALEEARDSMDRLFAQGEPGVDLPRVLESRRRILRARAALNDALWELSQARADLAAAVGDPTLALGLPPPTVPNAPCAPAGD